MTGTPQPAVPTETALVLAERAAPRYTSYPTAPHFSAAVTADTCADWLGRLSPCDTLSLYLHVPFCAAMCAYCGCHTKVTRREAPIAAYAGRLMREIALVGAATPARRVRAIHWGGGTPSMLGIDRIEAVVAMIGRTFDLSALEEHAIELDPRQVTPDLARRLAALGVTRASLGVQDLNPHVQEAIGRVQPYEVVWATVKALREAGIGAINVDLMYGLPHQSTDDLMRTIARAETLAPDRVALFGYAHVPWMKSHQKLIDTSALPGAAERLAQADAARVAFLSSGYDAIGLDHFARHHDAMAATARAGALKRNFQGYTVDAADALIGFGASAIGKLPQGYVQNAPDFGAYDRAIDAGRLATVRGLALTDDDRFRAHLIERLMCDFAVDIAAVAADHGLETEVSAADFPELADYAALGIITQAGDAVTVTEAGRPYLRLVATAFDAHLKKAGRHSVAV